MHINKNKVIMLAKRNKEGSAVGPVKSTVEPIEPEVNLSFSSMTGPVVVIIMNGMGTSWAKL